MPRLFTGLEIPNDVSAALSLKRGGLGRSRWIEPASYHITLRYIGDVDDQTANEVVACLSQLPVGCRFGVTLDHLGVFGGKRPRMLWAGLAPCAELDNIHKDHERVLQRIGQDPDGRKFTPHVTLARLKDVSGSVVAQHIERAGRFHPLSFEVPRIVLYSAKDAVGGGPYVVEKTFPMMG